MPEGKVGGSPGCALIGISSGFKLKSVESDCLKYALVSKKISDLNSERFFAVSVSSLVATSSTPLSL